MSETNRGSHGADQTNPRDTPDLRYAYAFDAQAENNTAASVHGLCLRGGKRVLDIGSGPAIVSSALARMEGRTVTCLDSDEAALVEAAHNGVSRTAAVDLESPDWQLAVHGEVFDVIVLADVLEHLRDPARLLNTLREADLLAPGGMLVISIPNANHVAVLAELLSGDFRYTETGLLDSTHIRWFTLDSLTRLLERSGFFIGELRRTLRTLEQTTSRGRAAKLSDASRAALADLGLEGRTYQYVLAAYPATESARLADLQDRLAAAAVRFDAQASQMASLNRRLEETQGLLTAERQQHLTDAALGAAELDALEQQLRERGRDLRRAQQRADGLDDALTKKKSDLADLKRRLNAMTRSRAYLAFRAARKAGALVRRPRNR